MYNMDQQSDSESGWGGLTAVDAKMLLQVMFVFEGFSTLAAFELAVSSSFVEQLWLQKEKISFHDGGVGVGVSEQITKLWNRS